MTHDILEVETRTGFQRIPLIQTRYTIGRLPGNDIVLPFLDISRHHAELRKRGKEWWITDMGSTNGMHLQSQKLAKEYRLRNGDTLTLAPSISIRFLQTQTKHDVTVEGTVTMPAITPALLQQTAAQTVAEISPEPQSINQLARAVSIPAPKRTENTGSDAGVGRSNRQDSKPEITPFYPEQRRPEGQLVAPPTHYLGSLRRDIPIDTPFALQRRQANSDVLPKTPEALLFTCTTCSARTAPDSPYCWNCRQTIAQPCAVCGIWLLPIQKKCPRCRTANPVAAR